MSEQVTIECTYMDDDTSISDYTKFNVDVTG